MDIGIPGERHAEECRVAITPAGTRQLVPADTLDGDRIRETGNRAHRMTPLHEALSRSTVEALRP